MNHLVTDWFTCVGDNRFTCSSLCGCTCHCGLAKVNEFQLESISAGVAESGIVGLEGGGM